MKKALAALTLIVVSLGAISAEAWSHPGRPGKNNLQINRKAKPESR